MARKIPPARTPEQREAQLISLAMDNAEKMMMEGKAPSQVITHFLKLGTERSKIELEKLRSDKELADAKVGSIKRQERTDKVYERALNAFRIYEGDNYDVKD